MPSRTRTAFHVVLVSARNSDCAAFAERLLRPALSAAGIEADGIRVTSAGLVDEPGAPFDSEAVPVLREFGGNPGGFRARTLDRAIVDDADLILTMSQAESAELVERFPRARRRTFTVVEYVRLGTLLDPVAPLGEHPFMLADSRERASLTAKDDILSPLGLGHDAYVAVGSRLLNLIQDLADAWVAVAPRSPSRDAELAEQLTHLEGPKASHVKLEVFGVTADVVCTGDGASALAKALRTAWVRCLRSTGEDPEIVIEAVLDDDAERLRLARARGALAGETVPDLMHSLAPAITVRAIDDRAGKALMLHAAGLALPDGRVVAFVAPSGTGKTTLSRALGKHYGYVSDETVFIELDGMVSPYPKPLSVIVEGVRGKEQISPDADGLESVPPVPLRLSAVVLLTRVPDAGPEPVVEAVPLLEGMVELATQISHLPRLRSPLRTLARLLEGVGGITRVTYSEAETLVDLVPSLVGERS